MTSAQDLAGDDGLKVYDVNVNGISLHVTEHGEGPAVLFCHGFPDTSYTWRRQMKTIASAGYRAIAPDMRGYGRSSAPADLTLYTPFQTAGDLVGLLDELKVPSAVLVGHDWGATHAWNAAMMRPDRFQAVFCLSVPYVPRGDFSVFERMRKAGPTGIRGYHKAANLIYDLINQGHDADRIRSELLYFVKAGCVTPHSSAIGRRSSTACSRTGPMILGNRLSDRRPASMLATSRRS